MVATRASAHLCTAGSDIIVTTTYSREPLLERDDVRLGSLVIGVGADAPYKCELSPDLVKSAGFVVVDSRTQNEELGDIARGIRSGLFGPERIDAEIGEILLHERQTRQSPDDTIICKLTGIAAQEAFVCSHLMQLI
jgi:ornithine cyclodeaminase